MKCYKVLKERKIDMKEENKNRLKKAGKVASGFGKAYVHASLGLAKAAADIALGTHTRTGENIKNRQFSKAADALRNIGQDTSEPSTKASGFPDLKEKEE